MDNYNDKLKENIKLLINNNDLDIAEKLLNEYKKINNNDIEIYSIEAIINLCKGNAEKSKQLLLDGLKIDSENFDINYNLGIIYENEKDYQRSFEFYNIALKNCIDKDIKKNLNERLNYLKNNFDIKINEHKKKIVFFSKGDDKFIWDIINELSKDYETKKITVTNYNQIDEWMQWADVCWFEWCDELIIYGSKLEIAKEKKIICRLHSYEAFTNYIYNVKWENVNKLIFVAEHIKEIVNNKIKIPEEKISVIPNGINVNTFSFKEHHPGYNIAYVGYINFKKGPMLLLHTFKAIYDYDKRYKLFIAGQFQDERYILYYKQMINELGLQNNIIFNGWQDDIKKWLEDKNYIICTSVLEGNPVGLMEAMASGIKPLIHNFVGANKQFCKYTWNTFDDCIKMLNSEYNSFEYREYIENNFSLFKQMNSIYNLLNKLTGDNKKYLFVYNKSNKNNNIIEKDDNK